LERVLNFLLDIDEATVDDLALGAVDDDQLSFLGVVLVLEEGIDVWLCPIDDALG
jgi:hypothetical protein